jgi:membrane-bound lytic murein transglycosylase MltF
MDKQSAASIERGSAPPKGAPPSQEAQLARLRAIRRLVEENNQSCLSTETIVCQIYMESRFDGCAQAEGSSARGLMQLLKVANRELFRLDNLHQPLHLRRPEPALYREADAFHDSPAFIDEATNIRTGTRYLQSLIDKAKREGSADPVAEAYKDYRGVRNGIYYQKIRAAAERLARDPDSLATLRLMVA